MGSGEWILAVDPGSTHSAYVLLGEGRIRNHGKLENEALAYSLCDNEGDEGRARTLILEFPECYGMAVGRSVFETCYWAGRFAQAFPGRVYRVARSAIKLHLCNARNAKDPNVRRVLLDRYGLQGTKKAPGPTYGLAGDEWSALAVGTYWLDTQAEG